MYLKIKKRVNYTLRKRCYLSSWYHGFYEINRLMFGFKKNCGRNNFGRVIVFSKSARKVRQVHRVIIKNLLDFMPLAILINIQVDPNKTSCVGLFFNSLGCWFYSLFPTNLTVFSYIKFFDKNFNYTCMNMSGCWPRFFSDIKTYTYISFIDINGRGVKYVKSAGSTGLFLFKNFLNNISVVVLPSLKIKLFSDNDKSFIGKLFYSDRRDFLYAKAGYNVNKGIKPRVRGTVKNACDHPNGGRTRSLKLSMTPWGFPAKKSRKSKKKNVFKRKDKRAQVVKNVFVKNKQNVDNRLNIKFLSKLSMSNLLK